MASTYDLDANRQALALQYFNTAKRQSLTEFRELCGKLLADQALYDETGESLCLFKVDEYLADSAQAYSAELQRVKTRRFPTSDRLPAMPKAQSIGLALEQYIHLLLESDDVDVHSAAGIVGSVYAGLLAQGHAHRPKVSPLDSMQVQPDTMPPIPASPGYSDSTVLEAWIVENDSAMPRNEIEIIDDEISAIVTAQVEAIAEAIEADFLQVAA